MHIEWTYSAKEDVKNIFYFYDKNFSTILATKIIQDVFNKVKTLNSGNELG
jgi:plasmid stabilization system protein ParE